MFANPLDILTTQPDLFLGRSIVGELAAEARKHPRYDDTRRHTTHAQWCWYLWDKGGEHLLSEAHRKCRKQPLDSDECKAVK